MTKKSGAQFTPRSRSSVGLGCRRPAIPREEDAMTGGAEAVLRDAAQRPRSPPGPASRPRTFLCLRPASPPSPWLFLRVFSPFFCFWGFFFPYYSFSFICLSFIALFLPIPILFLLPSPGLSSLSLALLVCFLPLLCFLLLWSVFSLLFSFSMSFLYRTVSVSYSLLMPFSLSLALLSCVFSLLLLL